MVKNGRGITLIALVITIIVLLILAGIVVSTLFGENGVIAKAKQADLLNDQKTVKENLDLVILSSNVDNLAKDPTVATLQYLQHNNYIDNNKKVNVLTVVGKELKTGKGEGTKDSYVIEDKNLIYYDKGEKPKDLGELGLIGKEEAKPQQSLFLFDEANKAVIGLNSYYLNEEDNFYYYNAEKVTSLNIPDKSTQGTIIETIGKSAFTGRSEITQAKLPEGLKTIKESAFASTGIREIELPTTIKSIEYYTFKNCADLNVIIGKISETYPLFQIATDNGKVQLTIKDGTTQMPDLSSYYYIDTLIIPASMQLSAEQIKVANKGSTKIDCIFKEGFTNLPTGVFYQGYFNKIVLPDSVQTIEGNLFSQQGSGSRVNEFVWPKNVTIIPNGCFAASGLQKIVIPNTVTTIEQYAFQNTRLKEIEIPDSVTKIGEYAFAYNTELSTVKLPNTITEINAGAFINCVKLTQLNIPESLTKISASCFASCPISYVYIPESVTDIEQEAFAYNNYETSFSGMENLEYVGAFAFGGCNIYTIPESVKYIMDEAFAWCPFLSVSLPENLQQVSGRGIEACPNLESAEIYSTNLTIEGSGAFEQCPKLQKITIKSGQLLVVL